ncbi:MAG: hypothetical protein WAW07_11775 [Bacteroidales bacterium]
MSGIIIIMTIILVSSCGSRPLSEKKTDTELKWSVRMANTVINRSDSLVFYVDRHPNGHMMLLSCEWAWTVWELLIPYTPDTWRNG